MYFEVVSSKNLTKSTKDALARQTTKLVATTQKELENGAYSPKTKKSRPRFKFDRSYGEYPHVAVLIRITSYRTRQWPPKIRADFDDSLKEIFQSVITGSDDIDIYYVDLN